MARLLLFAALFAAGYFLLERIDSDGQGPRLEGGQVVVETEQLEARFSRLGAVSESFMLFGGSDDRAANSLTDATLATLAIRHAQLIHQTYPDFHKCKSPGAPRAQRLTQTTSFIGADGDAESALVEAVDLHRRRVRASGDRTCLTVSGEELALDSVRGKADGTDLTGQVGRAYQGRTFYLARSVEVPDCRRLLDPAERKAGPAG